MSFQMKGVELDVEPTAAGEGRPYPYALHDQYHSRQCPQVYPSAVAGNGELFLQSDMINTWKSCIADTGKGMDEERLAHVFNRTYTGGHGFGLLNCKGIIEKYKKVSSIF